MEKIFRRGFIAFLVVIEIIVSSAKKKLVLETKMKILATCNYLGWKLFSGKSFRDNVRKLAEWSKLLS